MFDSEELFSVAEIAVALAGFSALVSVLAGRTQRSDARLDSSRLLLSLEASLFVAAFALFPLLPLKFGLDEAFSWRLAAGVYLASDLAFSVSITRRSAALGADVLATKGLSWAAWIFSALGQLSLFLAVLHLAGAPPDTLFFVALYLNLINAGLCFMSVAWNTFIPDSNLDAPIRGDEDREGDAPSGTLPHS